MNHDDPRPDEHAPATDTDEPKTNATQGVADEGVDPELLDTSSYRLTDKQAIALFVAYLVFRQITGRVGLATIPKLAATGWGWVVPLLNNSSLALIGITVPTWSDETMRYGVGAASLVQSTITGLILYWVGWRFGPELAKKAETGHPAWASIWNPKQVARAHRWLERWGVPAVALGRILEFLTTAVAVVAGSSRMTMRKYLTAWTIGSIGFAGVYIWLGGRIATTWPWLEDRIQSFADWSLRIGLVLLVLLVVAFVLAPSQKDEATEEASTGEP